MDKKVLILGDGLLGAELHKQTGWDYVSRKQRNFNIDNILYSYDNWARTTSEYTDIVNCIGYTNTRDNTKNNHLAVNLDLVQDLIYWCTATNKKLIHISTDYLYANSTENATEMDILAQPNNWYCFSKLLADIYIQFNATDFLTIRTSFKKRPYPYDKAWNDLVGNFDYVDVIGEMIVKLINNDAKGIYNVGTEVKTLYELAKRTNTDVKIDESTYAGKPNNVTMNLDKLNNFLDKLKNI